MQGNDRQDRIGADHDAEAVSVAVRAAREHAMTPREFATLFPASADAAHNPVFQSALRWDADTSVHPLNIGGATQALDLCLRVFAHDGLAVEWHYNGALFDGTHVARM